MCVTCGCSDLTEISSPVVQEHTHTLADGTVITHRHVPELHHHDHTHGPVHDHTHGESHDYSHDHSHDHSQFHSHFHSPPPASPILPNPTKPSLTSLTLEQKLLGKNEAIATQNRTWLQQRQILALNLVSSPGSGKTTLLTRTIQDLQGTIPMSVIEGDQATARDADRIRATGCAVVQVNTGTGCHLDASMVAGGLEQLQPTSGSIVMIENVGNLVCPALFDLGELAKVVILSVTEGEDKPIKYPHMFRASQVMVLTKLDLLPYVNFDLEQCLTYAGQVNPHLQIFQVSATTGLGLADWYNWLERQRSSLKSPEPASRSGIFTTV